MIASSVQNCILNFHFFLSKWKTNIVEKNNDTKIVITIRKTRAISMLKQENNRKLPDDRMLGKKNSGE